MVAYRRGEALGEPLALRLTQGCRLFQALLSFEPQGCDRFAPFQELPFGLTNQMDEDATWASAASAKAPHDLCDLLPQPLGLACELAASMAALLGNLVDALSRFFWALYSVVASVTR